MINIDNFATLLTHLQFTQNEQIWTKQFANNMILSVDFAKQLLIYPPDLTINERQTCNFSADENFVVFECVHRLLEKGYLPKHIELEKKWALGHLQKSGRADICVFADDEKSKLLFIIECKTFGTEYNKALKILKEDGGQLFSYWQQDRGCEWLSLYASDWVDNQLMFKNHTVDCHDDANLIKLSETDDSVLLYKKAHNKEELHTVWLETYLAGLHENVIFHENTVAYKIGIPPLRKKDLKEFNPDDKIINQFEEILRHNAVSDKENAFNRLIALFICKLVDEKLKNENNEVEFQYKHLESFEDLQDRLQQLYQIGMKEFMDEDIFYVANDYAQKLFAEYNGENRIHAIDELRKTIRNLKFYTNNDFAFKDVHNEELFLQNGKILVEMVQLFEKYRIVYTSKHQFLGDLFEQLLNKGFKQNEGQFFTPNPITRFIWDSLPLKERFANSDNYPKVIDYACGSGHFLTEAVEAINAIKPPSEHSEVHNLWVRDSIFGIEKDYRLARVSQVSMFMNGAGDANIIFGDGLDNHVGVKNDDFDILVANPPYSVSAFKSHLSLKNNQLNLLKDISNQGGEIEVLFCERIAQLLKTGGMGAVILPSSILSNDSGSYTSARQLLLSEFKIRAIVTLGSKTFGATGTNTVILFLEKFDYPPKATVYAKDCANVIFLQEDLTAWNDIFVYQAYLQHIGVSQDIYDKIRLKNLSFEELNLIDNEYLVLNRQAILAKFKLNKTQEKLSDTEKNALKLTFFFNEFEHKEKIKIEFFCLTYKQKTLIINAPSDNAKQKEFLGYDWSNRKGAEGIQIIKAGGKLYHDKDRFAPNTLASLVRGSFGEHYHIDESHQEYAYVVKTCDMLDFGLASFNFALKTNVDKKVEIESKYPLVRLGEILHTLETGNRPKGGVGFINEGAYSLGGEHIHKNNGRLDLKTVKYVPQDYFDNSNRGKIQENDVLICKDGALTGKIALVRDELKNIHAMINEHLFLLRFNNLTEQLYFFNYLHSDYGQEMLKQNITGSAQGGLNSTNLKNIKIPLPPPDIQQKIVDECQKIDEEYENSLKLIEYNRKYISDIFNNISSEKSCKINQICLTNPSKSEIKQLSDDLIISFIEMSSVSNHGYIETKIDKVLSEVRKGSYTYFAENDVIIAKITPCMENGKCALATGLTNGIALGSSEFHVFRVKNTNELNPTFLFHFLNRTNIRQEAEKNMTGASGHRRAPIGFYENLVMPLPDITEQQQIVAQIQALENQIKQAEQIMHDSGQKKKSVLEKYL